MIGQKTPSGLDGISYLPTLLGKTQAQHDFLYWEFHEYNGRQAIRKGNWKLVRLNVGTYASKEAYLSDVSTSNVKLFDLSANPEELDTQNLVTSNPTKTQELKDLIVQAHVYSPQFYFSWE